MTALLAYLPALLVSRCGANEVDMAPGRQPPQWFKDKYPFGRSESRPRGLGVADVDAA